MASSIRCWTPISQLRSWSSSSGFGRLTPARAAPRSRLWPSQARAWPAGKGRLRRLWRPWSRSTTTEPPPRAAARSRCQGRAWPVLLVLVWVICRRPGAGKVRLVSTWTQPASRVVSSSRATATRANPQGVLVAPTGGGGGGSGLGRRRQLPMAERPSTNSSSPRLGICTDQLRGRCRAGASSTSSRSRACWRRVRSLQPRRLRQQVAAPAESPWPIRAVAISKRIRPPRAVLAPWTSARGARPRRQAP